MKSEHDKEIFADVVKAALERGIDVPKIIANILKKHAQRKSVPPSGAGASETDKT